MNKHCVGIVQSLLAVVLLCGAITSHALADKPTADAQHSLILRNRHRAESHLRYDRQEVGKAAEEAEKALALSRQASGVQSADVIDDLGWLVQTEMDSSDYAAAHRHQQELVEIHESVDQKRPWEINAARSYLRYIERIEQLTPDEQKGLRESMDQIAEAGRLQALGKLDAAIEAADKGLARRKQILGFADGVYADYLALQGIRLLNAKQPQRAQQSLDESLEACRVLFGPQHRRYAATLMAISLAYTRAGKLRDAERVLAQAAKTFHEVLGPQHETYINTIKMQAETLTRLGQQAFNAADFRAAADWYGKAADVYAEALGKDDWRVREARNFQRQYERTAKLDPASMRELISAMESVGNAAELARGGDLDRVLKVLADAQPRLAALLGDDSPAATIALSAEADVYEAKNKPAEVERIYRRVADLRLAALGAQHPQTQAALQQLIDFYKARERDEFDAGQWQAAGNSLTLAIKAASQQFGAAAWQVRDLQVEADYVRRFAALSKDDRSRLRDAEKMMHEADNLFRHRKFADALNRMSEALKLREQILGADHLRVAALRYDMGDLHLHLDDYRQAESLLQTALDAQEKSLGRQHPTVAQTLAELGVLYDRIGERRKAIERFDEARKIYAATTGKEDRNYAWCVANLGMGYFQVRNLAQAEPLLQEALAVFESIDDRQEFYANTLNNLAGVYEAMGRDDLAEELFHRASDIWNKTNDRADYARSLDNCASLELRRGEFAGAEQQMLEANAIFTADPGPDSLTTAKSDSNLASLYYAWGKIPQADKFLQRALVARHKNLEQMAAVQSQGGQIEFFTEFRAALDMYLALSEKQHRSAEEVYREVLAWKGTIFVQQRQLQLASRRLELKPLSDKLHTASRQLAAAMFAAAPADDPDSWKQRLTELADEHARLERQIAAAARLPPPEAMSVAKLTASLPANAALVDVLEYGFIEPLKRDDRWRWQTKRRLVAFILRPGRKLVQVDLGLSQPVVEAVDAWREACIDKREFGAAAGTKLRDLVWTPLVKYLDGAETVLLAPDGPLTRVPFAALPGHKPGNDLIDEVGVAIIPAPQFLPELLTEPPGGIGKPQDSLLLIGDLNFAAPVGSKAATDAAQNPLAGQFPPLPGTQREIEAIRSLARDHLPDGSLKLLHGDEATKDTFADASQRHRTLHLATHGFFQPPQVRSAMDATGASGRGESFLNVAAAANWTDESQAVVLPPGAMCGLALSGAERAPTVARVGSPDTGILTAFEVAELDLSRTDMVVLSACQTGLGEVAGGEGVLGLQRAFQIAGGRTVVASLWKVDDDATRALMTEFYRRLWNSKKRPAKLEALRQAQLAIRDHYRAAGLSPPANNVGAANGNTPDRAAPFYWAAFVLSGDWR